MNPSHELTDAELARELMTMSVNRNHFDLDEHEALLREAARRLNDGELPPETAFHRGQRVQLVGDLALHLRDRPRTGHVVRPMTEHSPSLYLVQLDDQYCFPVDADRLLPA